MSCALLVLTGLAAADADALRQRAALLPLQSGAALSVAIADEEGILEAAPVVAVAVGGQSASLTLSDDGVPPDVRAGDGIYSGELAELEAGEVSVAVQVGEEVLWQDRIRDGGGGIAVRGLLTGQGVVAVVGVAPEASRSVGPAGGSALMTGVLSMLSLSIGLWLALTFGPARRDDPARQAAALAKDGPVLLILPGAGVPPTVEALLATAPGTTILLDPAGLDVGGRSMEAALASLQAGGAEVVVLR